MNSKPAIISHGGEKHGDVIPCRGGPSGQQQTIRDSLASNPRGALLQGYNLLA
jgi:hypothetical protein